MTIRFESVSKQYQLGKTTVDALKKVSFEIDQGEYLTIIGPSGSGKSTILNLLGALDRPTSGQVFFNDAELVNMKDKQLAHLRRKKIGFIFQSFNLIPVLSVFHNVEFPLILQKMGKSERRERVLDILNQVGLIDRVKHKTEELSGGQRQRVAIARALVTNPSLILSDEPTANLDSKTSSEILDLMQKLNEEKNVTLVYATHDNEIMTRSKRIIRILDGQIVQN